MNCPVDGTQLLIAERGGVEIDYCPQCRGVWLDRGELDKIIAREAEVAAYDDFDAAAPVVKRKNDELPETRTAPADTRSYTNDYDDDDDDRRYGDNPKRRRKSFFEDLFDIFD